MLSGLSFIFQGGAGSCFMDFKNPLDYTLLMPDFIWYMILGAVILLLILLLRWYINWKAYGARESEARRTEDRRKKAAEQGLLIQCPLCSVHLLPGEDMISRVYRPMNVHDQYMTINGCPHCYPSPEPGVRRACPVCGREVPLEGGYLTARLFNKTSAKKHVIVTGCSECNKKNRAKE